MDLSIVYSLAALQNKKMLFIAIKYYSTTLVLNLVLLKADLISWGEFGIMGAVIGSLFALIYFLLKPMIKMMVEDKQSDNEIKAKLANNVQALHLVLSEHIIKSDSKFASIQKAIENRDSKLESIDNNLREINSGIQSMNRGGNN